MPTPEFVAAVQMRVTKAALDSADRIRRLNELRERVDRGEV